MGFFDKIKQGLTKTRDKIVEAAKDTIYVFKKLDDELFDELEEMLISCDVGVSASAKIIERLREKATADRIPDGEALQAALKEILTEFMGEDNADVEIRKQTVILIIGVNGVGKTTSIGKLAKFYKNMGNSVLLAAGDTFRAAAIEQLTVWAERAGVDIIKQNEGGDAAAVIYDALNAARARGTDVVICDTAGRLHTKSNLMAELAKINKIVDKELPDCNKEVYLVLDATTGGNALAQAKNFADVADISGLILTKLDGTAKGGIVIAIREEQRLPVRFVCVGEGIEDIAPFSASEFVEALF